MAKKKKLPVRLLALSENDKLQRAFRLVEVKDCHSNKWRQLLIAATDVMDKRKLLEKLTDAGLSLNFTDGDFKKIVDHLKSIPLGRVKLCMRPGYIDVDGSLCYLSGSGKIFGKYEGCAPMPYPDVNTFTCEESQKGTLRQWQEHVASVAVHSPYAMLALCSAMAGYCIYFTDFESGGFHFYGDSSKGKSTVLLIAASVYGNDSFVCDWNITETAFEELAESRNHGMLILDELILLDKNAKAAAQKARKLIYILGSGGGKQRSVNFQQHKSLWQVTAISNGENGLAQHAADGDMPRKKGEMARFVDIPVGCGNELGIFLTVPDNETPSDYAERIKANCQRYHGTAGPALVTALLKKSSGFLAEKIDEYVQIFLKQHNVEGLNGLEKRIAKRFSLAYASGAIAVKCKILPFTLREVMEGISYCYMQACDKTLQKKEVFNQVLKKALNENAYPLPADTWNIETLNEVNVIATTISGINVLAVKADFFKANINGDLKQITALLTRQDRLFVDTGGKSTRQISCGGQRLKRRYCLKV